MPKMDLLNTRIRELRISHNLTQELLSVQTGISQANLSRIECGLVSPDAADLIRLSAFFCVSVDYLLGLTDQPAILCSSMMESLNRLNYLEEELRLLQGLNPCQRSHLKNFLESLQSFY